MWSFAGDYRLFLGISFLLLGPFILGESHASESTISSETSLLFMPSQDHRIALAWPAQTFIGAKAGLFETVDGDHE